MTPARPPPFPAAVLLLALAASPLAARDATVGACTDRERFREQQERIDPRIQRLTAEEGERDRERLGRSVARRYGKGATLENLIRYREEALRHVLVPLLEDRKWQVRARALYALKMAGGEEAEPALVARLGDPDFRVRELAANALCHVGSEAGLEALREAVAGEADPYVRASMEAAIGVLEAGEKPYRPWEERLAGPEGARRVEWAWAVEGPASFNDYDARADEVPVAESFGWPVSWYDGSLFASFPRNSFGAGGNHAGEDLAWFREGCSYYAVADGLVRMVQGAGGDWGFLVLLEHRLPEGDYVCSVYGHAAWDVLVRPGDVVRKGQKIATEGLSCSVENGGYGAHNHFGIADGPFRRPEGVVKGDRVEAEVGGERLEGRVLRFVYVSGERDGYGFPGLGAEVELDDGTIRTVPLEAGDVGAQVAWIQGYVPECRGWFDPYHFIRARREEGE